jgi:putative PEP-CTERM system TPR-repeat lipoprotein
MMAGCAENTKEEMFGEGLELLESGNPRGAIVLFRRALDRDQNFAEARFQLAKAYFVIGSVDSAEKEFLKVQRQRPSSRDVRIELARVYLRKARPDKALEEIGGLTEGPSDDVEALELAALAHAAKGDYPFSIKLLKRAFSFERGRKTAAISLARVYMMAGEEGKAEARVKELLRRYPSNRDALGLLAALRKSRKDIDGALESYELLLKSNPADFEALYGKGALYAGSGRYTEALAVLDEIIEKHPRRPEGYVLKGRVLFYKKDFEEAMNFLQQSLSLRPGAAAYYFLGLCHYSKNELEQALSRFYRALDYNPSLLEARTLVSFILLRQGRTEDAISEAVKVIGMDGENVFAHYILGSAYLKKGLYEEGMRELGRAVEMDPGPSDAHIKKGFGRGDLKDAGEGFEAAVSAAPGELNSRVVLASYHMEKEEFRRAIEVLKGGVRGLETDAVLFNLIAEAFGRQNRVDEAIRYLKKATGSNPGYLASYFNLSSLYMLKGEHEKAVGELEAAVENSPGNVRALLGIARIYETAGGDGKALGYYVMAEETGKAEGSMALAEYYLRKGKHGKALGVLGKGIGKNPSESALHEMEGKILLSMERPREAVRSFERIEKLNPGRGLPLIVNAYMFIGKPREALRKVREALKRKPESLGLATELSRILLIMGRENDAVENAEKIILAKPGSPVGYMTLARLYRDMNKPGRAIDVLMGANVAGSDRAAICAMLGDMHALRKDYASALDYYGKAEGVNGAYVPAVFGRGAALHAMGREEEAVASYKKVLRLSRNHVPALNSLAYLYAQGDTDLETALLLATRAYMTAPRDGPVLDTFGFVLLKSGRAGEAADVLKRAVEIMPEDPSVRYHLSLAYKELGDKRRAVEHLERALRSGDFTESEQARSLLVQLKEG